MTTWWYVEKNQKIGPVETDELKRLFQAEKIGPRTMLWHEGMPDWRPLDEVDELNTIRAAVPPPLPLAIESKSTGYSSPTPWPRFFARIFDLFWESLIVVLVLGTVLNWYSANFAEWINKPGANQLFSIVCLPVVLVLDALLHSFAGNTPGKAWLGLRVLMVDGQPLNFAKYLKRNFAMWVGGLALGIPIINVLTMAYQYRKLNKGGATSYDESMRLHVRSMPTGNIRKITFGIAFASMSFVLMLLNNIEQNGHRQVDIDVKNIKRHTQSEEHTRSKTEMMCAIGGKVAELHFNGATDTAIDAYLATEGWTFEDFQSEFVNGQWQEKCKNAE